jgi:DNA ligase-1
VLLGLLVETSRQVAATRARGEKTALLADLIRRFPPPLVGVGVAYLTGELPQGRLGIGYALLRDLRAEAPAAADIAGPPPLDLGEVDRTFTAIKEVRGGGAVERRATLLRALLARATAQEQDLIVRLIIGEVRQGALEGLVADAVARAFGVEAARVRRAMMLAGGLPPVAVALAHDGPGALASFELRLFHPIQPMLADTAPDADDALGRLGVAGFEYKLDGARVQVHKDGEQIEVYSRQLNRVTAAVPEVVAAVAALPARRLVLDGEAIALAPDGSVASWTWKACAPRCRCQSPSSTSCASTTTP